MSLLSYEEREAIKTALAMPTTQEFWTKRYYAISDAVNAVMPIPIHQDACTEMAEWLLDTDSRIRDEHSDELRRWAEG